MDQTPEELKKRQSNGANKSNNSRGTGKGERTSGSLRDSIDRGRDA